jgi:hypothetical protein
MRIDVAGSDIPRLIVRKIVFKRVPALQRLDAITQFFKAVEESVKRNSD